MKLFYKKDFQRVLKEKNKLEEEIKKQNEIYNISENRNFKLLEENSMLKDKKLKNECKFQEEINKLKLNLSTLKDELKVINGCKGGLIKENNKLKKSNEELKNRILILETEINELKSDRYLIKKIPSGKTKNNIKTKISPQIKPQVREFMQKESTHELPIYD